MSQLWQARELIQEYFPGVKPDLSLQCKVKSLGNAQMSVYRGLNLIFELGYKGINLFTDSKDT